MERSKVAPEKREDCHVKRAHWLHNERILFLSFPFQQPQERQISEHRIMVLIAPLLESV